MNARTQELFEAISEKLIKAIEGGDTGAWSKPWQTVLSAQGAPTNAKTNKHYQGMNSLYLWVVQAEAGYATSLWATYKQWEALGAQVRKGEKGTKGVKWGVIYKCVTEGKNTGRKECDKPGHETSRFMFASSFTVFNASQVDGYELPEPKDLGPEPERFAAAEALIEATGANVQHVKGDRAYFTPGTNNIVLPTREQFDTPQGYYGTALHELTHWSGDEARLGRAQRNVFGSQGYAAEELVAEFGSAMLASHFGIEVEPHLEHAAYLKGWVSVIRSAPMALYKAAKQAQEAVNYLLDFEGTLTPESTEGVLVAV